MTGTELAQAALEMIGAWSSADGGPDGDDIARALVHANLMIRSWNARGLALHAVERQSFTWSSGQSTRTIGESGANLTGTRPLQVLEAKVIPAGDTAEQCVHLLTRAEYAAIPIKAQTAAYFTDLLYEPTGRLIGTLTVWPVPTGSPTLLLHNKVLLDEIDDGTDITCPLAYDAALVSQLAKRLAPVFQKAWTSELEAIARTDWATVQSANIRVPDEIRMPSGFPGSRGGVSDSEYNSGRF